jgi:hypothetical protein
MRHRSNRFEAAAVAQMAPSNTDHCPHAESGIEHCREFWGTDKRAQLLATLDHDTAITPLEMIAVLERWCGAFLYTHIDTKGLMQDIPLDAVSHLRAATMKQLIVAGGIASSEQIDQLDARRIDAVVGMAIYTGRVKLSGPTNLPGFQTLLR